MTPLDLRMIPVYQLIPHEATSYDKVVNLTDTLKTSKYLNDPLQALYVNNYYILLDGHHRFEALKNLGVSHVPIQVVPKKDITLHYWYHIIDNFDFEDKNCSIENINRNCYVGKMSINKKKNNIFYLGNDKSTILWEMYNSYSTIHSQSSYDAYEVDNWIRYDGITLDDVINTAIQGKIMPPNITRFVIRYRILNLFIPLEILQKPDKKIWNEVLERAKDGRLYDEPTIQCGKFNM